LNTPRVAGHAGCLLSAIIGDTLFRKYVGNRAMQDEEIIDENFMEAVSAEPRVSGLAIGSLIFGMLGPFFGGSMWVLSFNDFIATKDGIAIGVFSCGIAWILGLILGAKSIEQIEGSEGRLFGKEYAVVGTVASAVWMILIVVGVLMPALFCINS